MGTASYIVRGKGNPDSFESCSHGAGRVMGRNEANKRLTLEEVRQSMKGIVFDTWPRGRKGKIDLSEAPAAYKDIDAVIEAQKDLIEVLVRLTPLGVVKG
jgi:tRNA-splicing ligase RtcB